MNTLLVAIDSAPFAGRVREWLPDLVRTGLRRVTLFHGIDEERGQIGEELEGLRPELDRLAVALSSQAVETDIALKRGDAVQWLLALAASRRADLMVVEAPADPGSAGRLMELLRESRCPVLVFPAHAPTNPTGAGASTASLPEPLHH
jgi:nucleotide-binding universal stress UspA family protein